MGDQIWSRGAVGNSSSAFIQNPSSQERFRATQMRSSQSHPRTFELGLKQLKIRRVRKLLMDTALQPARLVSTTRSPTRHTAFLLNGAGANANAVIAQLGRRYAIPMSPEMPSRIPRPPDPAAGATLAVFPGAARVAFAARTRLPIGHWLAGVHC
jgi:hypothetical protein